jgi:puromycin-sensitive aminopeptidase
VLGLARPGWERDVRAFFQGRQVQLGGKVLEQYLEQLHLAVRLGQGEGAALRADLGAR